MRRSISGQKLAAVGVALLCAGLVSAVYRSFVFTEFSPIRLAVIDAEQTASRRVATIALPDLSNLRGHSAVLSFWLRNRDSESRRIGLSGDSLPAARVVVPPNDTSRWDIVLSPEVVQALHGWAGDSARTLELTGDADAWDVMAFEIRNFHMRWGGRPMALVLPVRADRYTAAMGFLPVAIAMCVLGLLMARIDSRPKQRSIGLAIDALAFMACLTCVTCLILPRISTYKLLLSPAAFWMLAAALFAKVFLYPFYARHAFVATMRSTVSLIARGSKRHAVTVERGAAFLGLAAIAIAQPIFEVVSNSPEFFPARSTPAGTIVATVLAICFGVPLSLLGIERAIRAVSGTAAMTFHATVIALLSTALVMPWVRRGGLLVFPRELLISIAIGLTVALAYTRIRIVRQFLTALAPAALIVPPLFLLDPGVKQSFLLSESAASVGAIQRKPPIVLVIFDEFPLNSLLDAGGTIDAVRYPNLGAIAREAYWFRNASTVAYTTSYALPAILSGIYTPTAQAVPTLRHYPVNLFTALARDYDISASMRFQQLCPPRVCRQNAAIPADSVESLLSDLGLVWLHIVLPETLTEELPPVVGEWAEFGQTREAPAARIGSSSGRGGVFAEFLKLIDDRSARLHVIHLILPHMPFEYVPSGRRYRGPDYQNRMYKGRGLFEHVSAAYADTLHQRHLAQVGFADRLVGDLIARLRDVGAYEDALVIITADHGASHREGRARRQPRMQHQNLSDIIQVPLVMKLPGQRRGEIVDRMVETIDIFPTILDVVGARVSLHLDGRSLIGGQVAERAQSTFFLHNRFTGRPRPLGRLTADRAASLERKERRFGRGDLIGLYAPPDARHLLGMNVSRSGLRAAPDVQIAIHTPGQFEAVKLDSDPLPIYVRGVLSTSRSDPLNVAVVVNGIVTAIAHSYQETNGHMFGTLIPEAALRDGKNTVEAFVIDGF